MNAEGSAAVATAGHFTSDGGVSLAYRAWPATAARGVVVIVHGLGEHSGRYDRTARELAAVGFQVFAADLPGHGLSPGRRGHIDSFETLIEAVTAFRAFVETAVPERLPTFLLGHSLGGLVALRSVQSAPDPAWSGLILSAPALGLSLAIPRWKRTLASIFAKLGPWITVGNGIDPVDVSRDPEVVAAYRADSLVHDRISARLFDEMLAAMERARAEIEAQPIPASLWLVPLADRICDADAAVAAARRAGPDAEVRTYAGGFHEPFNDLDRARVMADVIDWLGERTG
jgi:lysophospholipase